MRVLMVHQVLGNRGGAESTIRLLAEGLARRGCTSALLHGPKTGSGEERMASLFEVCWPFTDESYGARRATTSGLSRALDFLPDVALVHKLDDITLLRELCDSGIPLVRMVHDHDIYCQRRHRYLPLSRQICTRQAGWACGIHCGVVRNPGGHFPVKLAWPGLKLRELALNRSFSHHITVSDHLKGELIRHDFDPSRITTLWPPSRAAAPDFSPTYAEPLIVFAGQLLRGKGVDVLLESLTRLRTPGFRLAVIGDGSHRATCEKLTRDLGLTDRVTFTGWVPQDELHRHYRSARVGVLPSVWPEPLGAVGIEMMQHGLPVVAFDVGGVSEWLQHSHSGYLVDVFDREGLARSLDVLLDDPEKARSMGERGRRLARDWCAEEPYFDRVLHILTRAGTGEVA